MKCELLNVNSFAFHVIKTLLQIVEAFQEPYYSHDTSLISIMYAKADTFDSEDNVALLLFESTDNACFTVLQMSTLNKTFDKTSLGVFGDVCIDCLWCAECDMAPAGC